MNYSLNFAAGQIFLRSTKIISVNIFFSSTETERPLFKLLASQSLVSAANIDLYVFTALKYLLKQLIQL